MVRKPPPASRPYSGRKLSDSSEIKFARDLQDARIARAVDDPEVTGHIHRGRRVVELGVVEKVEPFGADLQASAFTQFPDGEVFVHAEIPVIEDRKSVA